MNVPHRLPKLEIEPSHETSTVVKVPVLRGVSPDRSKGSAGDKNPELLPWLNIMKFALKEKNENQN